MQHPHHHHLSTAHKVINRIVVMKDYPHPGAKCFPRRPSAGKSRKPNKTLAHFRKESPRYPFRSLVRKIHPGLGQIPFGRLG